MFLKFLNQIFFHDIPNSLVFYYVYKMLFFIQFKHDFFCLMQFEHNFFVNDNALSFAIIKGKNEIAKLLLSHPDIDDNMQLKDIILISLFLIIKFLKLNIFITQFYLLPYQIIITK